MNDVTLRDYVESLVHNLDKRVSGRLDEMDRRTGQRFDMNDVAITTANRSLGSRLDGMNEFRDALKDQAARMATRMELEAIDNRVQKLEREKANFDGRLAVISGGISVVVGIIMWIIFHFGGK